MQKRLNRSSCRFGRWVRWSKEPCIRLRCTLAPTWQIRLNDCVQLMTMSGSDSRGGDVARFQITQNSLLVIFIELRFPERANIKRDSIDGIKQYWWPVPTAQTNKHTHTHTHTHVSCRRLKGWNYWNTVSFVADVLLMSFVVRSNCRRRCAVIDSCWSSHNKHSVHRNVCSPIDVQYHDGTSGILHAQPRHRTCTILAAWRATVTFFVTLWPWPLTFWPHFLSIASGCRGLHLYQFWCR